MEEVTVKAFPKMFLGLHFDGGIYFSLQKVIFFLLKRTVQIKSVLYRTERMTFYLSFLAGDDFGCHRILTIGKQFKHVKASPVLTICV